MTKKHLLLLTTLFFTTLSSLAQQRVVSKVVDATTLEPIQFATVSTDSSYTMTNELGDFVLDVTGDVIHVSLLGYDHFQVEVSKLPELIKLQSQPIMISEVVVRVDSAIIEIKEVQSRYKKLLRKYQYKFPKRTFFFRQHSYNGEYYTEFIESFFSGRSAVAIMDLRLMDGRYAAIQTRDSLAAMNITNAFVLSQIQLINHPVGSFISPLSDKFYYYYDITVSHFINAGSDDEIKVYRFDQLENSTTSPMLCGMLYIRTRDKSIMRFDGHTENFSLLVSPLVKVESESTEIDIIFSDARFDFPIVESVNTTITLNGLFSSGEVVDRPTTFRTQTLMFATDIKPDKRGRMILQDDKILSEISDTKYDPKFWNDNPIVKRTAVEEQIIEDFNRMGSFGNFSM